MRIQCVHNVHAVSVTRIYYYYFLSLYRRIVFYTLRDCFDYEKLTYIKYIKKKNIRKNKTKRKNQAKSRHTIRSGSAAQAKPPGLAARTQTAKYDYDHIQRFLKIEFTYPISLQRDRDRST